MTTVERVADQYRIIFDKAAKIMNKNIVITDEELREFGIEPQVSRTFSDKFDKIMKSNPNIVERTDSDALLQELEAELEAEEQLKSQSQRDSEPDSEPQTEDEFEIIENTNIHSVKNEKPKPKRFSIFGGNKPIDQRSTKDLLLLLSKMITQRNKLTINLSLLDTRMKQITDSDLTAEKKKKKLLSVLKAWTSVRKGEKPSDYSQKIKDLNTRINILKKYLREKRDITNETLEVIEDGWETIDNDEIAEARRQPVTPSKPKKSSWFGGKSKTKKGKKFKKKLYHKKTQRKNKQNKKKSIKKQRKSQFKKKTKKVRKNKKK